MFMCMFYSHKRRTGKSRIKEKARRGCGSSWCVHTAVFCPVTDFYKIVVFLFIYHLSAFCGGKKKLLRE